MARSRLELRREAEAAEARQKPGKETEAKGKKAAAKKAPAKRASRSKAKAVVRKRLVWVIYSGSMKEEGRFPYDQRTAAEERMEVLRSKSKKLYFLQPVKEVIGEGPSIPASASADEEDEAPRTKVKTAAEDEEEEEEEAPEPEDEEEE